MVLSTNQHLGKSSISLGRPFAEFQNRRNAIMDFIMLVIGTISAVTGIICAFYAHKTYKDNHKD